MKSLGNLRFKRLKVRKRLEPLFSQIFIPANPQTVLVFKDNSWAYCERNYILKFLFTPINGVRKGGE
jgi:hypothetical protein